MKISYLFLGFIAVLMWVSAVNHRDAHSNPAYTCYVQEKGC
jgi:hypothetical protein